VCKKEEGRTLSSKKKDWLGKENAHAKVKGSGRTNASGPLAVAPDRAAEVKDGFAAAELPVWQVGEVIKGRGVQVTP